MTTRSSTVERPAARREPVAVSEVGGWTLPSSLTIASAGDMEAWIRSMEDSAIDAEDILTQAEEANALDPVR